MASLSPPPATSPPLTTPPAITPPLPTTPLPNATPPASSSSPPPPDLTSSPPPPATPLSPPPATPAAPPPAILASPPPPAIPIAPPPTITSPPPPIPVAESPPPIPATASPPPSSPPPPASIASPPPAQSPPPPAEILSPPPPSEEVVSPPPPPAADPPKVTPPPTPPSPTSSESSPPPESALPSPPPPESALHSPPPPRSIPSAPTSSPTANNSSPSLPVFPTPKPIARSTTNGTVTVNGTASGGGGMKTGGIVAVGLIAGFVALSLVFMAVWFTKRKKRRSRNNSYGVPFPFASSQNSDSLFLRPQSPAPLRMASRSGSDVYSPPDGGGVNNSKSWFTYEELIQATSGFSKHNLLGEGGFGCVYKGVLVDGRVVAVKQLKIGGGQGEREFKAEVEIISRVHHRHLVSLVGYCISEHQRLLVYDFVANDTLHHHLHSGGIPVMAWGIRVRVAAGAARGIAYLHEDCHPRIIHRDIKSSNILLDTSYDAQVADFGLAKLALDSNTHVTTRVMGTFGYMAPEYATSGKLTEKSDVYSFGVVLLELITGRKPVDGSQPLGDESLVEWARPLLSEALETQNFDDLVDPKLEKNYHVIEMFRMIEAAAACVRHSATKRPRMSQVVRAFDALGEDISDLSNGMKPGQSEVYDSAEQNAQIRMFHRMAFGSQEVSTDFSERSHSQSRWASREHGDRTQTQTSFGSRDNNSGYQPQRSWTNREQQNQNFSTKNANPLAGFWDT